MRQSQQARRSEDDNIQPGFADLFADFNGLPPRRPRPISTATTPTGPTA